MTGDRHFGTIVVVGSQCGLENSAPVASPPDTGADEAVASSMPPQTCRPSSAFPILFAAPKSPKRSAIILP